MIHLLCTHCKYEYDITPDELKEDGELHSYCFICGGKIEVENLEEIIAKDLENLKELLFPEDSITCYINSIFDKFNSIENKST